MKRPLSSSVRTLDNRVSDFGGAKSVEQELAELVAGQDGLAQRIANIDVPSFDCVYPGSMVFGPESTSFLLDTDQDGSSSNLVNYVLRSGVTYRIPVQVGGDGVFRARGVRCTLWQRFYNGDTLVKKAIQFQMSPLIQQFTSSGQIYWTTKFSCMPVQPANFYGDTGLTFMQAPAINFAWNLEDQQSGWQYSDQLIPMTGLMPRTFWNEGAVLHDGDHHKFSSAWRIDTGRVLTFCLRPLTDVVQFDSSIAGTDPAVGLEFDDRENGIRNQSITAQVEIIGERVGGRP